MNDFNDRSRLISSGHAGGKEKKISLTFFEMCLFFQIWATDSC